MKTGVEDKATGDGKSVVIAFKDVTRFLSVGRNEAKHRMQQLGNSATWTNAPDNVSYFHSISGTPHTQNRRKVRILFDFHPSDGFAKFQQQ